MKPIEDKYAPMALVNAQDMVRQLVRHWEDLPVATRQSICEGVASVFTRMTENRDEAVPDYEPIAKPTVKWPLKFSDDSGQ